MATLNQTPPPTADPREAGVNAPSVDAPLVETAAASPRRAAWVRFIVMLLVGVGLLAWFLWHADMGAMLAALQGVHPWILAVGIGGDLLTPLLRAIRFRQLYPTRSGRLEVAGLMAQLGLLNMLMPVRTGEVAFLVLLKQRGVIDTVAGALPRWILLRACDLVAVFALAVLTAVLLPVAASMQAWVAPAQIGLALVVAVVVVGVVIVGRLPEVVAGVRPAGWLKGRAWDLRLGLSGLDRWSSLLVTTIWSVAMWLWMIAVLWVQYLAFDPPLTATQMWIAAVGVLTISVLPVHAPLAIGTLHAVQVGVLYALGVPYATALGIAFGMHAAMLMTYALQGLAGWIILSASGDRRVR